MITLSGLEKSFSRQKVLHDISLTIPEGSVTALIGPSGSGKSTLLRCINLLEIAQAGKLTIGNEEIIFSPAAAPKRKDVRRICQQTGMVFQNFQLFPHLSVLENIMQGLVVVQKWPRERARARAEALLAKVGLAHKRHAWPAMLSGGQQQRVAIARAMAPSPKVLLCDEPTSALDPELSQEVIAVLRQLAQEGTTMLMATHDLRLAANIASQVVFLESGQIVESGTSRDIFTRAKKTRTQLFISTLTETFPDSWEI
ncbi:amino acid ABC transporter ATP-binding protein [Raoultella ornithinolytica]|jgi:cystine transport system ATP-binding protein|uniref:Amino acid ABC transporter ATP-binding protein n=1 Tax=Raoultella ornithinolytica TaxID=54291 RepID=A0ABZ2DW71_RAOOR|nr:MULTISPECIES: amino acid ABC transporter ATP-binding protein [Raoultella]AGJ89143.1 amino acid ABC transporter ATP-binding protein [Raoultella ornithinolytica B6]ANZ07766.1 ATP-binding protein [Raoultella ornithinolytica]AOO58974.1 ATP-binding protein [Raoultella ornithinolytica]ASI59125.1 amino acid ABC transporter ATP-binding protein [Raoultella ornithinolytica]ATM19381.1 amino acid ABC transporter ATP-binding protein [Raoultella ornithinolytica]